MHGFGDAASRRRADDGVPERGQPGPARIEPATDGLAAPADERLTAAERERRWPNVRPRDAATLIIIDRSRAAAEGAHGAPPPRPLEFMPGKFVFPGGRIEAGDRSMPAAGALHARAEARPRRAWRGPPPQRARALALAAIRETFEETGLLLGTQEHGPPDRRRTGPGPSFRDARRLPRSRGAARWWRGRSRRRAGRSRFDTRFFAVDREAIADEVAGLVGPDSELVELVWVDHRQGEASSSCPTITQVDPRRARSDRIAGGFAQELPIPFYYERRGRFVRELLYPRVPSDVRVLPFAGARRLRSLTRSRHRRRHACVTAVGIGLSLSIPLLSLEMERMDVSGTLIGLNTAVAGIASICVIPFVPRLARRIGVLPLLWLCIVVGAVSLLAFKALYSFAWWFPLRFVFSAALGTLFVLSEFWINTAAPPGGAGS